MLVLSFLNLFPIYNRALDDILSSLKSHAMAVATLFFLLLI